MKSKHALIALSDTLLQIKHHEVGPDDSNFKCISLERLQDY